MTKETKLFGDCGIKMLYKALFKCSAIFLNRRHPYQMSHHRQQYHRKRNSLETALEDILFSKAISLNMY